MTSDARASRRRPYRPGIFRIILRDRLIRWLLLVSAVMFLLVIAISVLEASTNPGFDSITDIAYWAVVTLATVGYGDISPSGGPARALTIPFIVIGVVLMSFMTATIASILTATRIREGRGLQKVNRNHHVVVCGYNGNIEGVLDGIIAASPRSVPDIVLINTRSDTENSGLIERFPEANIRFVSGDYTSEPVLYRASLEKASSVIILADPGPDEHSKPDDRTLLAALAVKSVSRNVEVCAELLDDANEAHLRRAGVDQIVLSGEFSGFLLSSSVMTPGITQAIREIMRTDTGNPIRRVPFPPDLVGGTFHAAAVAFLEREDTVLLGVITERKSFNMEDFLSGDESVIDSFIRRKFEEAGRSLEVETKGRLVVSMNPGKDYRITPNDFAVVLNSQSGSEAGR